MFFLWKHWIPWMFWRFCLKCQVRIWCIPSITLQGSSLLIFKSAKVPTMRRFLLLVIVQQRYVINVIEIPYILIYSHMKQPEYGTQFTGYLILLPILLGNLLQISEPEWSGHLGGVGFPYPDAQRDWPIYLHENHKFQPFMPVKILP